MSATDSDDGATGIDTLSNAEETREAIEEFREEKVSEHETLEELEETRQHLETEQEEKSFIDERVDEVLDEVGDDGIVPPKDDLTSGTTIIGENVEGADNIRVAKPNSIGQAALEGRVDADASTSTRALVNYLAPLLGEWAIEKSAVEFAEEFNATELATLHQEMVVGGNLGR